METVINSEEPSRRVFISYSTADRRRVDGLERLLVLFGHKVFLDFKQIRLGSQWKDEIKSALDQTDITLVYWTRSASSSLWVRNEYEYFLARYPSRPLVPIVGDETPLPEPLKERQAMTFVPVINELLELKRSMEAEGRKRAEIQAAIRKRLEQAGIRLKKSDENRVFRFFGIAGWMAWLPAPLVLFKWVWRAIFEATAQLSPAQVVLMVTVAAAAAALTRQADNVRIKSQARASEEKLANQLEEARNAAMQRESEAKAREVELANQLADAHNASIQLGIQFKKLTNDATNIYRKVESHALMEVAGMAKPALLRFIDKTTGRHRFTVQIPSQEDFSFWIPKGSYWIYLAHTDISDKMGQLVGGAVERDLLEENRMESGMLYKLVIQQRENTRTPIAAEKWGQAGPVDKR